MKSFTDIKQSRKLSEILPAESADQIWERIAISGANLDIPEEMEYWHNGNTSYILNSKIGIPCWSLAALLEQFEDTAGLAKEYGLWFCYDNRKSSYTKHYDNPVDACVEMIVKLKEKDLL